MSKMPFFGKGFRGPPFVLWRMEEPEPLDNQRVLCYIHGEPDAGKGSSLSSPSHRLKSQAQSNQRGIETLPPTLEGSNRQNYSIEPAWD